MGRRKLEKGRMQKMQEYQLTVSRSKANQRFIHQEAGPKDRFEKAKYPHPKTGGSRDVVDQCPDKSHAINGAVGGVLCGLTCHILMILGL